MQGLLRKAARSAIDLIDLRWRVIVEHMKKAAPYAHGRLLDVGCGNKPHEAIFRPYVDEYVGVEHEATFAVTDAAKRGGPDVLYDGKRLPFEDASFDTVMAIEVLEHTPEPARLLAEMRRVLRKGGTLIVSAPFSFRLHEEPHDYFRYTPYGMRELLGQVGLDVVEQWAQGGLWTVIGHKLNVYLALRLGRFQALGQAINKMGQEGEAKETPRYWMLPLVVPAIATISASTTLLDRVMGDRVEAHGYTTIARCPPGANGV
jgi:SAM-dependent methyltransferase